MRDIGLERDQLHALARQVALGLHGLR
jgi:uncharacterized protein YjiS (DUF1127 family)